MKQPHAKIPRVSVIIPLYNRIRYIEACLQSVLGQTYLDFEVIVVNDGSTDHGPEIVRKYTAKYPNIIRLLEHGDGGNHGVAISRNLGIKNAESGWIAFLDSDDLWLPRKLEKQMYAVETFPEIGVVYSKSSFVDESGRQTQVSGMVEFGKGPVSTVGWIFSKLTKENFIPTSTVLVRKDYLQKIGCFAEGPRYEFEDWIAWSKLAYYYDFHFIPEVLTLYRIHTDTFSYSRFSSGEHLEAQLHYIIKLYTDLFSDGQGREKNLTRSLRISVLYFMWRTRSWGATYSQLTGWTNVLVEKFPNERLFINICHLFIVLIPFPLARILRRVRRKFTKL
jgi:glycosyltransferase involved in cell wall biosynthesis